MKKRLILVMLVSIILGLGIGCTKKEAVSVGDPSAYTVEGDVVHVNNKVCAMSRSPMDEKDLGKWTSQVTYTGKHKHLDGKTLVFNQCCAMCVSQFGDKWKNESEDILKYHGLIK